MVERSQHIKVGICESCVFPMIFFETSTMVETNVFKFGELCELFPVRLRNRASGELTDTALQKKSSPNKCRSQAGVGGDMLTSKSKPTSF